MHRAHSRIARSRPALGGSHRISAAPHVRRTGTADASAARVLRPAGHLLVGFQSGKGTRDVSRAYRQFGHEIELERHLYTADDIGSHIEAAGLREVCRLVRRAQGKERDDQAILLAKTQ